MQAVLFDIGGVIVNMERIVQDAEEVFRPTDRAAFWEELNQAILPACRGHASLAEVWRSLAQSRGLEVDEETQARLWSKEQFRQGIFVDESVLSVVHRLKESYPIGVISNSVVDHSEVLRQMGVYEPFDIVLLSEELGMAKDDPQIFDLALQRLGASPQVTVYIDDVENYVQLARAKGILGILFKDSQSLEIELRGLGLLR